MITVGVAELRQNLSRYLQLVATGERRVVTNRNRPVAEVRPPPSTGELPSCLVTPRRMLPEPVPLDGDPHALSRALDEIRGDR
jgi:prevent-host-death family protein